MVYKSYQKKKGRSHSSCRQIRPASLQGAQGTSQGRLLIPESQESDLGSFSDLRGHPVVHTPYTGRGRICDTALDLKKFKATLEAEGLAEGLRCCIVKENQDNVFLFGPYEGRCVKAREMNLLHLRVCLIKGLSQ